MSCANSIYLDPVTYILILTQLNKYFKCPLNYDTLITQIEIHYLLVLQCGISTAYTVVSSLSLWMGQLSIITDAVFGTQLYGLVYSDVTVGASKRMPVAWRHRVWVSGQSGELGGRQQRMRRGWAEDTLGGQLLICESLVFFYLFIFLWLYTFYFPTKKCSWGGFKPGDGSLTLAWGCVAECNRGGLIQLVSRKMMFMLHWNAAHQALERHKRDPFC